MSLTLRPLLALPFAALVGCVSYTPGLEVELVLGMSPPPSLAGARLTLVELLPCPGTTDATSHHHDATAAWSMGLASQETALLTPRPGHYCDLRLQIEGPELAPRQAVLPLTCDDERVELALDEQSVGVAPVVLLEGASADDPVPAHALELLLESARVSTCAP